jgi:hypothetical protein
VWRGTSSIGEGKKIITKQEAWLQFGSSFISEEKTKRIWIVNKFLFYFSISTFLSIIDFDCFHVISCKHMFSFPQVKSVPFFAHKEFLPNPSISHVLPSYAKAQVIVMVSINLLYPSYETFGIDLDVLAYINYLASNG